MEEGQPFAESGERELSERLLILPHPISRSMTSPDVGRAGANAARPVAQFRAGGRLRRHGATVGHRRPVRCGVVPHGP